MAVATSPLLTARCSAKPALKVGARGSSDDGAGKSEATCLHAVGFQMNHLLSYPRLHIGKRSCKYGVDEEQQLMGCRCLQGASLT